MAFLLAECFDQKSRQVVIIVPDKDRAEKLRDDCSLLTGGNVHLYTHTTHHVATTLDMTEPIEQIETLKTLARKENCIVVSSAEAVVQPVPPPQTLLDRSFELAVGHDYPFERLINRLTELGFERKEFVEGFGDFAVRGGIMDIYPFVGENPVRLEFWGDRIESIREFDAVSQRSIRVLQSASIVAGLVQGPSNGQVSLLDYLEEDAVIVLDEPVLLEKEILELNDQGITDICNWEELRKHCDSHSLVIHSNIDKPVVPVIDFQSTTQPPVAGRIKLFLEHVDHLTTQGISIVLMCDTEEEAARVRELIEEERSAIAAPRPGPLENGSALEIVWGRAVHSGFIFTPAQLAVFTEHEVFGRLKRRGITKRRAFRGLSHKELLQLRRGDFVVHHDYGIGKFDGLQRIKVRGVEQEVMKIHYAENDVVYVNLNFVNRVQKYSSQEGHTPQLTKIGTPQWERLKSRAKRKITDIARELIQLYARRKHERGFAFSPDTHWQKEMEASFMYEDTEDQAKATAEVKRDMESPSPMDRLICGDVGFGKTEVAVRAAFKAVMDGKQAAILVPTTILALQHYHTFLDRLGNYGVKIGLLSRFKSPKEQKQIVEQVKQGQVDILIGTHRILSKDIGFKNLGLLVIDEEHRFGVAAKEKIRQHRAQVDTLTLTATPIPRTLQFSLLGARDLSIINTPPRNRLPIKTEIAQFDPQLIREAILKELHRGGQVYFIHDRVHDIERIQAMLAEHVPEAKSHVAHGQMPGHELEKTMINFLEKKYDVLICTKIIESGIDIPSVNTIIIHRADRFGLAELYQLRGRVGRSNVQAYAYLLTPPLSSLPRATLRRLQAIQEFTELGSGFNLAMRDLEIRGAGNLLGPEQSGFIMEMGFEMYQRIVEEAVRDLKEQEFQQLFPAEAVGAPSIETTVDVDVEAFIPEFYVESDTERLDFYRRLYKAQTFEELEEMRRELRDRFGEYPEEVEHLFRVVELRILASRIPFVKIELVKTSVRLSLPPAEEKGFFEGTNGQPSPFEALLARLPKAGEFRPELQQEGNVLTLNARLRITSSREADRLTDIRELLKLLQNDDT
ncbi:MAG TPA: transcription-repair coupling factor [Bacteroidota bacterium]|nr:transcription-repair coupling factor [Bacteroidota bacterium]